MTGGCEQSISRCCGGFTLTATTSLTGSVAQPLHNVSRPVHITTTADIRRLLDNHSDSFFVGCDLLAVLMDYSLSFGEDDAEALLLGFLLFDNTGNTLKSGAGFFKGLFKLAIGLDLAV